MEAASNRRAQRNDRRPIASRGWAQNPAYKPTDNHSFRTFDLIFPPWIHQDERECTNREHSPPLTPHPSPLATHPSPLATRHSPLITP